MLAVEFPALLLRFDYQHHNLITQYLTPFAKAFAVFVKELTIYDSNIETVDQNDISQDNVPWNSWSDLPKELRNEFESEILRNNNMLNRGEIESVELTDHCIASSAISNQLKQILKEKGLTQKELANRLNVNPSFISKVISNPERSTIKTLRGIANAIGVDLNTIIK